MPAKPVQAAKAIVKSSNSKSASSSKATEKKAVAPVKPVADDHKKAVAAKSAPAPGKKAAAPVKAAATGSKPSKVITPVKKPAASSKPAPAAKKAVVPAAKAPATGKKDGAEKASAKKAVVAAAPKKAAPPAKKNSAEPAVTKKAAPAAKVVKPEPAVKGVSPKAPGAAPKVQKPVPQAAPAKGAVPVIVKTPGKTKKSIKEEKAKAAVKAKILAQVAARQAVALPSPAPNAFILREEKKVNTVVAHRRMSPKVGEAPLNGITPGEYKPEFVKSILDREEDNTGPVFRYSDDDLAEFKVLIQGRLEVARKELAYLQGLLTHKDEAGTEDTENRYMNMEDGSGAMERENMANLASRQIQFIDHLEKAIIRIENKTYGICRVTGKLIDKARLRAVPHATLSMEAKSTMNRN